MPRELRSISRFLLRYAAPVFIPWMLIGALLGSRAVLIALFPVSMLWLGTAVFIDGYLDIRSGLRRKRYLGAATDFMCYGFGLMIALVTIYVIVKDAILRK
jgi:hypothetical protein